MADPDTAPQHGASVVRRLQHEPYARATRECDRVAQRLAERSRTLASRLRRAEDTRVAAARSPSWSLLVSIGARIRAGRLDRALASGADPTTGLLLARRALQLTTRRTRARFADALEAGVAEARTPRTGRSAAIPVSRRAVVPAAPELRRLIKCLRGAGDVSAQGMARTRRLLTDGSSPLYAPSPPGTLAQAVAGATECLCDER